MKKIFLLIILGASLISCGNFGKRNSPTKADHFKAFVEKVGYVNLPYSHDLDIDEEEYKYQIDVKSTDSLFFDNYENLIIGVLPDTSGFYAILYYIIGDDLYPALKTFDKNGEEIDKQIICYGNCAGCDYECDFCSEVTTITSDLKIKITSCIQITRCDDDENKIPETTICKIYTTTGQIKPDGTISLKKEEVNCEGF